MTNRTKKHGGRRKRAVKTGHDALAGLPIEEKWQRIRYGTECDPEALEAVHALHNAACIGVVNDAGQDLAFTKQIRDEYRDEAWAIIVRHYREDWPKHDGKFFLAMAHAMRVHQKPIDPVWSYVGSEIMQAEARQLPPPPKPELKRDLAEIGVPTSIKTIGRISKAFERRLPPAKRGPKPNTKRKGVHRARR